MEDFRDGVYGQKKGLVVEDVWRGWTAAVGEEAALVPTISACCWEMLSYQGSDPLPEQGRPARVLAAECGPRKDRRVQERAAVPSFLGAEPAAEMRAQDEPGLEAMKRRLGEV